MSQRSYADGFDSGMSFGNGIVLEGGRGYSLRLVLKGAPTDLQATMAGSGGALLSAMSRIIPDPAALVAERRALKAALAASERRESVGGTGWYF